MFQVHYPGCAYYGTNENEDACLCAVIRSLLSNKRRNGVGRGTFGDLQTEVNKLQTNVDNLETNIKKIEGLYPITINSENEGDKKTIYQGGTPIDNGLLYNPNANNCYGFKIMINNENKNNIYKIRAGGIEYIEPENEKDFKYPTRVVTYIKGNDEDYEGSWLK